MAEPIRKLAIVGASARAAAFSALRAGYEVVAADLFADADLRRACRVGRIDHYPEGLEDWLEKTPCDAWMYTGALENQPRLVHRLAAIRPLLGNDIAMLAAVRDPLRLQEVLLNVGVNFPETVTSPAGLPTDGSWLSKTYRHSSGAGVWRLQTEAQCERARREEACFQRFIEGTPASAVFAVFADRSLLLGVSKQLIGSQGDHRWRYRGSVSLPCVDAPLAPQLWRLGEALSHDLHLRGLVGVDLVLNDEAWVIEINPRYSASIEVVERSSRCDAIPLHVAACTHGVATAASLAQQAETAPVHGKAILYATRDVTISPDFFDWAMTSTAANRLSPDLADIPAASQHIMAGHPVLTVFTSGDDCERLLSQRLAEVERRMYADD
jgi:predicted ATP-grasp superfamily ATP-dependent carboligase